MKTFDYNKTFNFDEHGMSEYEIKFYRLREFDNAAMKTNEIQMFARIAALQFDKLYKNDKSADFVLHCRKFYHEYRLTGCTVGEFEMKVYAEYAKI